MSEQETLTRDVRQREMFGDKLKHLGATVIGVGAIGRQVALQLAAMGVGDLILIDPDVVSIENLSSQGWSEGDIGQYKVDAIGYSCKRCNNDISVVYHRRRYQVIDRLEPVVFCCVDSIDTRRHIWSSIKENRRGCELFVDGRMSAEVARVLTVQMGYPWNYEETLFKPEEAYKGSCTRQSTIYCANVAAGLMVAQFTKWLRGIPTEQQVLLNLLSTELEVS